MTPAKDLATPREAQLSNSAEMVYACPEVSHLTVNTLGWQQTWQSSTYRCFDPAEESTVVSIHSPHAAH